MFFMITGAVAGILLGLRFKAFVLIPATLIAAFAIIAMGHGFKAIVLTTLATAALLQIGYVLGCVFRVYAGAYLSDRARRLALPIAGRNNLGPTNHSWFDPVQ
jgi:hypothetical protein